MDSYFEFISLAGNCPGRFVVSSKIIKTSKDYQSARESQENPRTYVILSKYGG